MVHGFGIGRNAQRLIELLGDEYFLNFYDNNINKCGKKFKGHNVYIPERILDLSADEEILITSSMYFTQIFEQLIGMGVSADRILYERNGRIAPAEEFYCKMIYSQEGEEIFLQRIFGEKRNGFYVDVGAYHPYSISNTYWAYKRGWHGINIEPNKERFELISSARRRDINLNCGIGYDIGMRDFYRYDADVYNTFAQNRVRNNRPVIDAQQVEIRRLRDVFKEYGVKYVDFLDIDVEGLEMEVLKSIDYDDAYISYILVEQIPLDKGKYNLEGILHTEEFKYLKDRGFVAVSKYNWTVIYENINTC